MLKFLTFESFYGFWVFLEIILLRLIFLFLVHCNMCTSPSKLLIIFILWVPDIILNNAILIDGIIRYLFYVLWIDKSASSFNNIWTCDYAYIFICSLSESLDVVIVVLFIWIQNLITNWSILYVNSILKRIFHYEVALVCIIYIFILV